MGATIETTGLFVEAAYGPEGAPGTGGVTGGGESHEVAWKQALLSAKQSMEVTSGSGVAEMDVVQSGGPSVAEVASENVKTQHPLSWDRLSMTVASMVAWNMSVELSDDVAASPIDSVDAPNVASTESEGGFLDGEAADVNQAMNSPEISGSDLMVEASSDDEHRPVEEPLGPFSEFESPAEADENILSKSVNMSVASDDTQQSLNDFREGTAGSLGQDGMQLKATGLREVGSFDPMDAQQGTTLGTASPAVMMGMDGSVVSEIPSVSPALATVQVNPIPDGKTVSLSPDGSWGARPPEKALESIVAVRDSSVRLSEVEEGRQRLEGIRSVLSKLEDQANIRNTVANLLSREHGVVTRPDSLSTAAGAVGPVSQQVGAQQPQSGKPFAQTVGDAQPLDSELAQTDDGRTFGTESESSDRRVRGPERPIDPIIKRTTLGRAGGDGDSSAGQPAVSSSQLEAALVGTENAEISEDQQTVVESAAFDSEHIEASEVPELPIQDVSHLDIDIDDQMGTVRLAMTREAEEVSIRMETPAEVLEQYREMEEEMAEAIGLQGLDLSEFSADANDSGDESDGLGVGSEKTKSSVRDDAREDADGALKQSGSVSRLVNRIV